MANSYILYNGTGALTDFTVPFGYIQQAHVTLEVSGVSVPFTWLSTTVVRATTAPVVGTANVKVKRSTPRTTMVTFSDGAGLTAADLNLQGTQSRYIAEEQEDAYLLGILNGGGTLTVPLPTSITGGGTLALGGFTLTVPATGTPVLTTTAQSIAGIKTFADDIVMTNTKNLRMGANGDSLSLIGGVTLASDPGFQMFGSTYGAGASGRIYTDTSRLVIRGINGATNGVVDIAGTTASITTTSGSLINAGGFGNGGAINAGGAVHVRGATIGAFGVSTATETSPALIGSWDATKHSILAGPASAIGSPALAVSVNQTSGEASLISLSPSAGWNAMAFRAGTFDWFVSSATPALSMSATGSVLATMPLGGLGYGTGAGGTTTQATSKATGVTLNKVCGQVTMQAAALAAGAKVSFVVTNSACAATDGPRTWVVSGGTANAYRANVTAVAAGSFTVTVENITAGALSEAPVIGFDIGKSVIA